LKQFSDLLVNIAASIALIIAGYLLRSGIRVFMRLRISRSWSFSFRSDPLICIGIRSSVQEPSGEMGAGDALALQELSSYLSRAGVPFDVAYVSRFREADLARDLILIGGPDVNVVTKNALARINGGFESKYEPEKPRKFTISIYDRVEDISYLPDTIPGKEPFGPGWVGISPMQASSDYGIFINCPSPFDKSKRAIFIYGAFGYGTLGALRWINGNSIPREIRSSVTGYECLIPVDVIAGRPVSRLSCVVRAISAGPTVGT
jgi:hypothetical protein